jgi:hypothetical protein
MTGTPRMIKKSHVTTSSTTTNLVVVLVILYCVRLVLVLM